MSDKKRKYLMIDATSFKKKVTEVEDSDTLAKELLDKNNVPLEYQKIIVKVNVPMIFSKYEAEEVTTGFPFDLTAGKIENNGVEKFICASNLPGYFNGQTFERNIYFRSKLQYNNYDEVMDFLGEIYDNGYFKQYLESIKQLFSLNLDLEILFTIWNEEKNSSKTLKRYKKEYKNKYIN